MRGWIHACRQLALHARRWLGDGRGQSLVELGLATPILVGALIAGVDLMRVAAINQAVQNAARTGADYIALNSGIPGKAAVEGILAAELDSTPGIGAITPVYKGCWPGASATPPNVGSPRAGQAYYQLPCDLTLPAVPPPYQGVKADGTSCKDSASGICYYRVRVQYAFTTVVPWPLVPRTIIVDRTIAAPIL